jgi:D-beta-D-heptose 7-phosphate kinase / D-beta-D-heptose 1-phosphate adenosyltransferase
MRVLVVGDVILDQDVHGRVRRIAPDAPVPVVEVERSVERAGGAALAAALLAGTGAGVQLATCLGDDEEGARLRRLLRAARVDVLELCGRPDGARAPARRTRVVRRVRSQGQSLLRMDSSGSPLDPAARVDRGLLSDAIAAADGVLVADYGAGAADHPEVRAMLSDRGRRPLVWDPHPRGPQPVPGVTVATPNRAEAAAAAGAGDAPPDRSAAVLRQAWRARAVAVTDGSTGVFTALEDSPVLFVPTPRVCPGDSCGAGDMFAGTLTARLAAGMVITEAVAEAVIDVAEWLGSGGIAANGAAQEGSAGSDIGAGAGADSPSTTGPAPSDLRSLLASVRGRGGTVVATGGCFDVLHAGHVASLHAARALGDCLVVLLNSDDSVRRLKGPGRPVHGVRDRTQVLSALRCVDAVVVFGQDTPEQALRELRPDIWAKGGDYASHALPEAELVREWGGRVVVLPYLSGRSTTEILNTPRRADCE